MTVKWKWSCSVVKVFSFLPYYLHFFLAPLVLAKSCVVVQPGGLDKEWYKDGDDSDSDEQRSTAPLENTNKLQTCVERRHLDSNQMRIRFCATLVCIQEVSQLVTEEVSIFRQTEPAERLSSRFGVKSLARMFAQEVPMIGSYSCIVQSRGWCWWFFVPLTSCAFHVIFMLFPFSLANKARTLKWDKCEQRTDWNVFFSLSLDS